MLQVVFKSLRIKARDLGSAVAERDTLRKETQELRRLLKEAKSALNDAKKQAKATVAPEELENAKREIQALQDERVKSPRGLFGEVNRACITI